jgi:hypothetical protein
MAKKNTQIKLIFTGLNDSRFKMGNKMNKVLQQYVTKYGKNNVSLVEGGNKKSNIDTNIRKLGDYTNTPVTVDAIDRLEPNSGSARKGRRIADSDTRIFSFNKAGELNKVDKGDAYWGMEDKAIRESGKAKKSTYIKGKLVGKRTTQDYNPNDLIIDKISGTKDLKLQEKGIQYLRNKDEAWIKSQRASGTPEVDIIQGSLTDAQSYELDIIETGEKHIKPSNTTKGGDKQVGDVRIGKDTNGLEYLYDINEDSTGAGIDKGNRKLKGLKNTGTLNSPKTGTRNVTKTIDVKSYGQVGDTYDYHAGKAIPREKKYSVKEIKKVSVQNYEGVEPGSSWSQIEGSKEFDTGSKSDRPSIEAKKDFKIALKREDVNLGKTSLSIEGSREDKSKSGTGMEVHTKQHLRKQGVKEKLDIRDIKKFKSIFNKISILENPNKNLPRSERLALKKKADVHAKSILTSMTDLYGGDAAPDVHVGGDAVKGPRSSSVTSTKAKAPAIKQKRQHVKMRDIKSDIKKGPEFNKNFKESEHIKTKTTKPMGFNAEGRPTVRGMTNPLKRTLPFAIGIGGVGLLQDAFGEASARSVEKANLRSKGGGGKRNPFFSKGIPGRSNPILTKVTKKTYHKYA